MAQGDEVLVPAYNCGTEIDALVHSGLTPVGYRITRQCEIDFEDLISKRTSRTKCVYLIHYFGWEQPMIELKSWCDRYGLLLIEDCALALFSGGHSGGIGRIGDAAIYSLSKSLGFVHGGLLSLAAIPGGGQLPLLPSVRATRLREIRKSVGMVARWRLNDLNIYKLLVSLHRGHRSTRVDLDIGDEFPDIPPDYYFKPSLDLDRALDPVAETILNSVMWEQVVQERRENYLFLANALGEVGGITRLLQELPEGTCPLSLPLLVPNRGHVVRFLQNKGVAAYPWWAGFHQHSLEWHRFPDACSLKQNLVTIPVYQGLVKQQLCWLVNTVIAAVNRSGDPRTESDYR
jgi:dTDP-4-amino-4,6-dideoxygalactose transaminase